MRGLRATAQSHALALAAWFVPYVTAAAVFFPPWRRERALRASPQAGWWAVVAGVAVGLTVLLATDPAALPGRKLYIAVNSVVLGIVALGSFRFPVALRRSAMLVVGLAGIGAMIHIAEGLERSVVTTGTAFVSQGNGGVLASQRVVELSEVALAAAPPALVDDRPERALLESDVVATIRSDGYLAWPDTPNIAIRAIWSDDEPLAGRSFRVTIEFDSVAEVARRRCRGVRFGWSAEESFTRTCEPSAWVAGHNLLRRSVTVPEDIDATELEVAWFDIGGLEVRLRAVTVETAQSDSSWSDVTEGLRGSPVTWSASESGRLGAFAVRTWRAMVPFDGPSAEALATAPRSSWSIGFGPWGRWSGWSAHPNAMAHLVVIALSVSLALAIRQRHGAVTAGVALIAIAATGSRSGLLAGVVAVLVFAARSLRGWRRWLAFAAVIGAAVSVAAMSDRLRTLLMVTGPAENTLSRWAIAQAAWQATLAAPWTGSPLAPQSFFASGDTSALVLMPNHAHNVWLEIGSQFGLLAFLAIAVWTIGLLVWALGRDRWRRVGLVLPAVLVSLVDTTTLDLRLALPFALALMQLGNGTYAKDDHDRI